MPQSLRAPPRILDRMSLLTLYVKALEHMLAADADEVDL